MLPDKYFKYYQIKAVTLDGQEVRFINCAFRLFHGEQPLLESIGRNHRSGKNVNSILSGLLRHANKNQVHFRELRLYQIDYDWEKHRNAVLNDLPPPEEAKKFSLIGQANE